MFGDKSMSFLKRMKTSRPDLGLIDMIFVLIKSVAAAANYGMRMGTSLSHLTNYVRLF